MEYVIGGILLLLALANMVGAMREGIRNVRQSLNLPETAPPAPQRKLWPRYPEYAQPPDWYTAVDVARVEAHKYRFVGYVVSTVTDRAKAEEAAAVILRGVLKKYTVVWAMNPDEASRSMAEVIEPCIERFGGLSDEFYRKLGIYLASNARKFIGLCRTEALLKDLELTYPKKYHGAPCSGAMRHLHKNDEECFIARAFEFMCPIQFDIYRRFPAINDANIDVVDQMSRLCRESFELEYGYFNQVPDSVRDRIQAEEMFVASAFAIWVIYGTVIILEKPKHVVFEGDKVVEMYWDSGLPAVFNSGNLTVTDTVPSGVTIL
jgi:hypothetical protein